MFDRIAPRYDLLNRLLSFRRDVAWRKRLAALLPKVDRQHVLDLATGTGDVMLALVEQRSDVELVVGMDLAYKMLGLGLAKVRRHPLHRKMRLARADAAFIAAHDASFHAVTIAFGIRNVTDVLTALREIHRVLKPGGRALILEFSLPTNPLFRAVYLGYFRHVLPLVGGVISGDRKAYRYLNRTVESFPYGDAFCTLMREASFCNVGQIPLSMGIASIYIGEK